MVYKIYGVRKTSLIVQEENNIVMTKKCEIFKYNLKWLVKINDLWKYIDLLSNNI